MRTFVINLDRSKDRMHKYKDKDYIRWSATDYRELSPTNSIFSKMISYHNIDPLQHQAKCACFVSHINVIRYIATNKMDDILILEDDAIQIRKIPNDLPNDSITYLGGFMMHPKITDGLYKEPREFKNGINTLDKDKMRIIMLMAYYIPKWQIAQEIIDYVDKKDRVKALDIMIFNIPIKNSFVYPAIFIEERISSTIRKDKSKFSNEFYEWK